jgi:hypothetical protein
MGCNSNSRGQSAAPVTPGVITAKYQGRNGYSLFYTFKQRDGRELKSAMTVDDKNQWNKAAVGEDVTVLYFDGLWHNRSYEYGYLKCV